MIYRRALYELQGSETYPLEEDWDGIDGSFNVTEYSRNEVDFDSYGVISVYYEWLMIFQYYGREYVVRMGQLLEPDNWEYVLDERDECEDEV